MTGRPRHAMPSRARAAMCREHRKVASRRATRPGRAGDARKRNHAKHIPTRIGVRGRSALRRVCCRADIRRFDDRHFDMQNRLGPDGDRRYATAVRWASLSAAERRLGLRQREWFIRGARRELRLLRRARVLRRALVLGATRLSRCLSGVRRPLPSPPPLRPLRPLSPLP
jgi:hypothetical protein